MDELLLDPEYCESAPSQQAWCKGSLPPPLLPEPWSFSEGCGLPLTLNVAEGPGLEASPWLLAMQLVLCKSELIRGTEGLQLGTGGGLWERA